MHIVHSNNSVKTYSKYLKYTVESLVFLFNLSPRYVDLDWVLNNYIMSTTADLNIQKILLKH